MEPTHHCPCPVFTLAAPPRRLSAGSARPGRCPEGARGVTRPGWESCPSGGHSRGLPMPQGAQPAMPPDPLEPQHLLREKASRCPCPLHPPRHAAGTGKATSSAPPAPQNPSTPHLPGQPCSGGSTRSTSLRGEGTSSARLRVLAPAAGTKEGAGTLGCSRGSPLPSEACRMCTISPICSGR